MLTGDMNQRKRTGPPSELSSLEQSGPHRSPGPRVKRKIEAIVELELIAVMRKSLEQCYRELEEEARSEQEKAQCQERYRAKDRALQAQELDWRFRLMLRQELEMAEKRARQ